VRQICANNQFAHLVISMPTSPLAAKLIKMCEERGVTQRQASLGATGEPDTIRNIVRGRSKNPRLDTLQALAVYFNVPVAFFSDGGASRPAAKLLTSSSTGLEIMGRIAQGIWKEPAAAAVKGHLPIAPDPRWPAVHQAAYELGDDEYVIVLKTSDHRSGDKTLVLERTLIAHNMVELSLAKHDGNGGFTYLDGKAVPKMDGVRTDVIGVVLWRLCYHGP
jgi:transcriptional regulator with XRE-family HTH domain